MVAPAIPGFIGTLCEADFGFISFKGFTDTAHFETLDALSLFPYLPLI